MNKIALHCFILTYGIFAFCFQPFENQANADLKKRVDIMKEIAQEQKDLESFAISRYGEFGSKALAKLEHLSKDFRPLIVVPGIILAIDKFEKFVNENRLNQTDPWEVVKLFSGSLGKKTVYRGIILSDEDFAAIKKKGLESDALRQNKELKPYNDFSFPMELLRRVRPSEVRLYPNLPDRTLSISSDPEVSRMVSMGFANMRDIDKKDMYIFKIELPVMENLTISRENSHLCDYAPRNNEDFHPNFSPDAKTIRSTLCRGAFFPAEVESFVEFLIEPDEIKEYEKIALTKSNILKARKTLENIIKKQSCDEIDLLKDITDKKTYDNIKKMCAKNLVTIEQIPEENWIALIAAYYGVFQ